MKAALPDSEVAKLFQSKGTKATYLITDGLYPKVKDDLIRKMKNEQYSLMVDESNKKFGCKCLNILVQLFDYDQNQVCDVFIELSVWDMQGLKTSQKQLSMF